MLPDEEYLIFGHFFVELPVIFVISDVDVIKIDFMLRLGNFFYNGQIISYA